MTKDPTWVVLHYMGRSIARETFTSEFDNFCSSPNSQGVLMGREELHRPSNLLVK